MSTVDQETATQEQPIAEVKEEQAGEPIQRTRVHVTNLPWAFNDEQLNELFSKAGKVVKASIVRREQGDSKGYGFVDFETQEASAKAVELLNNASVEERRLGVVFSTSSGPYKRKELQDGEPSERLHVRGIHFGVKKADLLEVFGKHGEIETCHLVSKRRLGRAYGFIKFKNVEDATKAREELNGTKLNEDDAFEIRVLYSKSQGPRKKSPKRARKENKKEETEEKEAEETDKKSNRQRRNNRRNRRNRNKQDSQQTDEQAAQDENNADETKPRGRGRGRRRRGRGRGRRRGGRGRGKQQNAENNEAPAEETKPAEETSKKQREPKRRRVRKRIFIKPLPSDKSEDDTLNDLRAAFKSFGEVLKYTVPLQKEDNTKIRGWAYVKFATEEAAQEAKTSVTSVGDVEVTVRFAN